MLVIDLKNVEHPQLCIPTWRVKPFQSWSVLGRNGSGKQWLIALLCGELKHFTAERAELPNRQNVGVITFEKQQQLFEHELAIDCSDLTDAIEYGTEVRAFLPAAHINHPLIDMLHMRDKLDSGYRQLSTGESRKLLLLQAVLNGAQYLVCENPFDSLDPDSCQALSQAMQLLSNTTNIILFLNNVQDIPSWCECAAIVEAGHLNPLGPCSEPGVQQALNNFFDDSIPKAVDWPTPPLALQEFNFKHLVEIQNLSIQYASNHLFDGFNLQIKPLQHTLITGSNGSGKSTLMQLITGDNPFCYTNHVVVFNYRRGSGESIWDIKRHLGIVSTELHRNYRVNCDVLTVLCSGFFDTIGVYKQPDRVQINHALHWLRMVGMEGLAKQPFHKCSYGEQRLALIARALVKSPLLLILDEPTQGLDSYNRRIILQFIEKIAAFKHSTVVLVSHRVDEQLSLFKQHIDLDNK